MHASWTFLQARLTSRMNLTQTIDASLGSDRFVNSIPSVLYKPRSPLTLEQLAEDICKQSVVSSQLVRSRSAARSLTPVRIQILEQALDQRIATLTEVARFLHRDPSTLCKLASRSRGRA